MAFMINCTNKGCCKTTAAELDLDTNEVICADCKGIIKNIPIFTKTQLKSLKQIKKPKKETFSVRCISCNIEGFPVLLNNQLCCQKCKVHLKSIPKSFEILIREAMLNKDKDLWMLNNIVEACSELLVNYPEAKSVYEYANSRLSSSAQKMFQFGYFPSQIHLPVLVNTIGEEKLSKIGLLYSNIQFNGLSVMKTYTSP
jgi:hypothetical protein